jgi:O-antigen/teichoic acid export membrane protein
MISKNLLKSSFIYTVIGALPLASAFFLLPFYTNYLSKSDFGVLALYISFSAFIQIIINFGLDTYIGVSFFEYKDQKEKVKSQIGTIAAYLLLFGIIIVFLLTVFGNSIFSLIFKNNSMHFFPFGLMSVFTAFFNSFFKTYTNLLINQKRPERFFWVNSTNFILTIGFSLIGLMMFPFSLNGPIWGRFLSGIGIFIIALYSFQKEFGLRFKFGDTLRSTFSFSLPVLVFFILQWIVSNNYPYIIDHIMTTEDIAMFDFAVKCTLVIDFALSGLSSAIMPNVYGLLKDKELTASTPELNKYFSSFTAVTLLGIPFLTLVIPIVIPIVKIKADYFEAFIFIAIMGIGFVSRGLYNYFLAPIYFFKKTKVLPKIYLFTAIIQIVASIVFIKYWGLWGAVWSSLLTKILQNVFLYHEARKLFIFRFNKLKLIILPLFIIGIFSLSEAFFSYHSLFWKHLTQFLLSFLLVSIVYRKEMKEFIFFIIKTYFRKLIH